MKIMKTRIAAIILTALSSSSVFAGVNDPADPDLKAAAEMATEAFLTCVYTTDEDQLLSAVQKGVDFIDRAETRQKVLERLDRETREGLELLEKALEAALECAMNLNARSINGELSETTERYLKEVFN